MQKLFCLTNNHADLSYLVCDDFPYFAHTSTRSGVGGGAGALVLNPSVGSWK